MTTTLHTTRQRILASALAITACLTTACSATATRATTPAPPSTRSSTITPPPAPGTLPAIAEQSVPLVAQLHDNATLSTGHAALPAGTFTAQAEDLSQKLRTLAVSCGTAASARALHTALDSYVAIAHQLSRAPRSDPKTLATKLTATDKQWESALTEIGKSHGLNLLRTLPPLPLPT